MVNPSILKHLLTDDQSLSTYCQGRVVSIKDVRRRLFLLERNRNSTVPDHFYHLVLEDHFRGIKDIETLLCNGLSQLAGTYLTLNGNRIYAKKENFSDWQQLITFIPPLVLISAQLFQEQPIFNKDIFTIRKYFTDYLVPNTLYSAIPSPNIPEMEQWVANKGGLHDLHVHLNGATETDIAWQDFLFSPDKLYKDLKEGAIKLQVLEQFEQESHLLNPRKLYQLIKIARRIRQQLYEFVFPKKNYKHNISTPHLFRRIINGNLNVQNYKHPFIYLLGKNHHLPNNVSVEGLMYVLVLTELKTNHKPALASLFHFYLLILGLFNRLLVQQVHQYGFDQFQKYTINKLRDQSELKYHSRFFQMHGNDLRNISILEGRFSPKASEEENNQLLTTISTGWNKFNKKVNPASAPTPRLTLVAHFIKRKEKYINKNFRYKELRIDLHQRADVLIYLLKKRKFHKNIVGVDAASNELHTPPEVFGPVFRRLRRSGAIRHFTFHVGEDFFHILSGLRAMFEAVVFTGLQKGDRIGHATAAGIDPQIWFNAVGETIFIRRGEWLDDLIFAHYFITTYSITQLNSFLPGIKKEIGRLLPHIYINLPDIDLLKNAWLLRQYCPMHVLLANVQDIKDNQVFDPKEWTAIKKAQLSSSSIELFKMYHAKKNRPLYDEIISIESGFFDKKSLKILQLELLKFLYNRDIVIETLPTSNVRISCYENYSTHHLWNWKEWQDSQSLIPKIVVGSDDTGIFATSIFNEYAHLYCHLINEQDKSPQDALKFIDALDQNSRAYRFGI